MSNALGLGKWHEEGTWVDAQALESHRGAGVWSWREKKTLLNQKMGWLHDSVRLPLETRVRDAWPLA